ncbi:DUF4270 domain-containing protein [Flavobacterium gawalongense]|uniref:DUF4270 domain-containing protein n=2 Tax=Flavobacterium gawalongense TaxID=2594432 RepID=A0A553BW13_9FLAO|nr:DUF4270 domain-containing protein [Flavobacterium gawalongense]TRX12462.1 DUF4270 domain-containing protein [Flavobacterium gawalongense]TRX12717.1 DUF4270 domain-containing protein [Flavobacterium gawalongense]TRX30494.1 DUF4270 domain-containing protein [Flavobacterium gawalongense]
MYNISFFKKMLVLASIILLYSCDKDYNAIGGDLIGDNHFDLSKYTSNVIAYNQKIGPIQSNNLAVNALGIYKNPAFGTTNANFATQLVLASPNPEIGANPVIDSVYLTVPYYSTLKSTNADGSHEYELDSIYGESKAKIKLSVFESGYFMRDLDPIGGFQEPQKYFTDQNADLDNAKVGSRLNNDVNLAQNDGFFFDSEEIVETTKDDAGKVTTTRSVPAMRLKLDANFFKNKIINAPAGKLITNDVFKEYFRGLYFKVEKADGSDGSMAMLNFKSTNAKITIKYKEDLASTTGGSPTRVEKSIVLNLSGNTVSLLEQSNTNTAYTNAMISPDTSLGDEKLYLKGGEGSLAILDLFDKKDLKGYDSNGNLTGPNGISDELDDLRNLADGKKWLINEANLVFHIDASAMANSHEPNRIYLYDLTNNRPLVDYYDASTNSNPKKAKGIFDGNINKEVVANGRGLNYKIRITNQIRNLIMNADSTNVKLGLVVTEDISTSASSKMKTPNAFISQAPKASVMNPLGTILYGGKSTVPEDKRLKLEIFYTKPN